MPKVRDPALKLFGRTIPLLECGKMAAGGTFSRYRSVSGEDKNMSEIETACSEEGDMEFEHIDEAEECSDNEGEAMEGAKSGQGKKKALVKPDKILPCPRCNSSNTKFCYYNNYNVNQPRHFCKNCQRYWTAGGTMRNVPVGAGRRKNKNAAVHRRVGKNDENSSTSSSTGADSEIAEIASGAEVAAAVLPPSFPCYPWTAATAPPPFYGPYPLLPGFFCYPWAPPAAPQEKTTVGSLWFPKTLRIDDPDEAAKSSIWATLGIKPDPKICSGGIFRGFDHKSTSVDRDSQGVKVNHSNPAALSRSQAFKEST